MLVSQGEMAPGGNAQSGGHRSDTAPTDDRLAARGDQAKEVVVDAGSTPGSDRSTAPARGGRPPRRLICDAWIVSSDPRVITWWREVPLCSGRRVAGA